MPAKKRSHEALYEEDDDDVELPRSNENIHGESEENNDDEDVQQDEQETDDDRSASSSCSDKDDYVLVKLAEIRKEVQCPICLGIIRKTRTVMECLHRFCRECIDKSMRLGNNECPACRAHCASRRSLRDDPNYDALISSLYPDIDKFEAEEFAFHEEEKARNKQIQASIAQTCRRQLEALGKKRKTTGVVFMRRSQTNTRNLRGRRSRKSSEPQESDNENDNDNDNEEDADNNNNNNNNNGEKDSSSGDEPCRPKRCTSSEVETREMPGGTSEILAWGRGGIRSNSGGKNGRTTRVSKVMDHLRKLPQNNDKHVKLVSLDEPSMEYLYLCCSPTMAIKHVGQFVGVEKGWEDDKIEVLLVKGDELQLLQEHQTLLDVAPQKDLTLAYRKKLSV